MIIYIQEEERSKHEKLETTHLVTHVKKNTNTNTRKGKNTVQEKKESKNQWRFSILTLGCMGLDLVFHMDEPSNLIELSRPRERNEYERWK